jgi:ketosteroid isomerase-like protein
VRQAYDAVFKAIELSVAFNVAEVVEMAPDRAFARTNSAGTVTVNATGVESAEANQELFIFRKVTDGKWKIARHSFSTTNPPPR